MNETSRQARLEQKSWDQGLEVPDMRTFGPLESGLLERALLRLLIYRSMDRGANQRASFFG